MHEALVKRLGGLRLPRKSVVRLTDRPDMTLDVYRGRKTTMQQHHLIEVILMSTHNIPFSIYNKRKSSKIIPNLQRRDFLGTKERANVKESLMLKPLKFSCIL